MNRSRIPSGFEEEYVKYYQWLVVFGIVLVSIGGILAILGPKMITSKGSRLT